MPTSVGRGIKRAMEVMLSTVLGVKQVPAQRALWSQPRPVQRATRQSGRREQLWEGQGSVTEEVTGPQFVGGERPKELLVQAPGMTREGRVRPVLRLQPRLVGRPRRLPGAALTPSDPLGAASKTQAPSPLETGLHPGPGVEACCPVVGKSGTSPCGS